MRLAAAVALSFATLSAAFVVPTAPRTGSRAGLDRIVLCEYSTKVRAVAETRAPLRQARIFFLWPGILAGSSIGSYVSVTRVLAGISGMRTDTDVGNDAFNTAINLGVVAFAVFLLRGDLKGRDETLKEVAREYGQLPAEPEQPDGGGEPAPPPPPPPPTGGGGFGS